MHSFNTWKKSSNNHKEDMIKNMQPGSIIYDLAVVQGGNTDYTEVDKVVEKMSKNYGGKNILKKAN